VSTSKLQFHPWTAVRDALEHAYALLQIPKPPEGSGYTFDPLHWNIAGVVRDYVIEHQVNGHCMTCNTKLTFDTVIRCLDCKMPFCEYHAKDHFGPQHGGRAAAAHPCR